MDQLKVVSINGQLVTESREVAKLIDRPHNDLMKTIRTYIKYLGQGDFSQSEFFIESTYKNSQNKEQPCFLLSRKGCDMIANKLNGLKGVTFTASYVTKFEQMENQLSEQVKPSYTIGDPIKRAEAWISEHKERLQLEAKTKMLEQQVSEYEPKITYVDEILRSKNLLVTTQIAEDYGMTAQSFNKLLHESGVQYKMNGQWLLYGKYKGLGYTKSETTPYKRKDGSDAVSLLTKWTQKGRLFLYEYLKSKDILPTMEQMKLTLIENTQEVV